MIEHIKIFFSDGTPFLNGEYHVGTDRVKKIFFDKENLSTLVVLTEDNIVTYHGFLYVAAKAYKE